VKLLLDENLSRRLVVPLLEKFPDSTQVALVGLQEATDFAVWEFARLQGYVIVTKDDDFNGLQALHGYPPKLIVLQLGNCTNQQVLSTLLKSADRLIALLTQEDIGFVEIS
jgi:predicted nuclease of predicted toxin-antitoxin system